MLEFYKLFTQALTAAVGSFVSTYVLQNKIPKKDKPLLMFAGFVVGVYVGLGMIDYLDIEKFHVQNFVVFSLSLFGVSFISHAMAEVPVLLKAITNRLGEIISTWGSK